MDYKENSFYKDSLATFFTNSHVCNWNETPFLLNASKSYTSTYCEPVTMFSIAPKRFDIVNVLGIAGKFFATRYILKCLGNLCHPIFDNRSNHRYYWSSQLGLDIASNNLLPRWFKSIGSNFSISFVTTI